jgi:hypothetical protein
MAIVLNGGVFVGKPAVTAALVQAEIAAMPAFGSMSANAFIKGVRDFIDERKVESLTDRDFELTAVEVMSKTAAFKQRFEVSEFEPEMA